MIEVGELFAKRYEVLANLGEGGMGTVYKVRDAELNLICALKLLSPYLVGSRESRERFLREGQTMSCVAHKNVARIFRLGMDDAPFIIMEYLEGKSLRKLLVEQEKLPRELTLDLISQTCAGMSAAHEKNILHRDLKPDNIIVVPEVNSDKFLVKVLDFGLARFKASDIERNQHLTRTGEVIGSIHYMSPEQCVGGKLDERSDVYELGCVLYECLTGHPPFEADSTIGVMHKHRHGQIPKISGSDDKDATLNAVINKALAKKPHDRYESMQAFLDDLTDCINGCTPRGAQLAVNSNSGRPRRTLLAVLVLTICSLIALTVVTQRTLHDDKFIESSPVTRISAPKSNEAELTRLQRMFELSSEKEKPATARVVIKKLASLREDYWHKGTYEQWFNLTTMTVYVSKYTPNWKTRLLALYIDNYNRCYEITRAKLDEKNRALWLQRTKQSIEQAEDLLKSFSDVQASINGEVLHCVIAVRQGDFILARRLCDSALNKLRERENASPPTDLFAIDRHSSWTAFTLTEWIRQLTNFDYGTDASGVLDYAEIIGLLSDALDATPGEKDSTSTNARTIAMRSLTAFYQAPPREASLRQRYQKIVRDLQKKHQ